MNRQWPRIGWIDALVIALLGCGDDVGPQRQDASTISSDGSEPAGAKGDAGSHWNCQGDAYGCTCDNRSTVMPARDSAEACAAAACCVEVSQEDGDRSCACLSVEGTAAARTSCTTWTDEQLSACAGGQQCQLIDACPPGALAPSTHDAGDADASQLDSGTPAGTARDGAAADAPENVPNDAAEQGRVQHCVFGEGCFEFRDHNPSCFEGDQINCEGGFRGSYAVGECPTAEYSRVIEGPTGCGTTVSFLY